MIARGKITIWTLLGLAVGIWALYSEVKRQFGNKEAHVLLYLVFGYVAVSGLIALLVEWSERKDRKRMQQRMYERVASRALNKTHGT